MTSPLVSVLTPSLNQAAYLGDCLASVQRQTYGRIEHVVADGGSTDGSVELLRHAESDVRWLSEPDEGQSDALNRAFARSEGEIIGWLNSDDGYADRRALEWAVETFRRRPDADVVFGSTLLVNEENTVLQVLAAVPFSRRALRSRNYVIQPGVFFRRSALERLDTFARADLQYVMDRDLLFRITPAPVVRLGAVVAFDRHQRQRKVLQDRFRAEVAAYDASLGAPPFGSTLVSLFARAWLRFGATLAAGRLPYALEPAVDLVFPPLPTRLAWQLAYPRRRLPFASTVPREA